MNARDRLEHEHAGATRNHKTIARYVVCAARFMRLVIKVRGHRIHRIKQNRERPIELFSTASKDYETCKRRLERWYDKWETAQGKIVVVDEN